MTPEQWVESVIGKPWAQYEQGPDAFDCWGLVCDYYYRVHDIILPPHYGMAFQDGFYIESESWVSDDDGLVLCAFRQVDDATSVPTHIGVKIGHHVIHAAGAPNRSGQVYRHRLSAFRRLYGDVRGYSLRLHKSADR